MFTFSTFKKLLLDARENENVHCILENLGEEDQKEATFSSQRLTIKWINSYISRFGFQPIESTDWTVLNHAQALKILTRVTHRGMAYEIPLMDLERAEELANQFFSFFEELDTIYLSNGMYYRSRTGGSIGPWCPITTATFDTGIIAFDGKKIGIVWFEDED